MRDKLLDFIVELSQSSKQVVAKEYILDRLLQITKEDYKELKELEKKVKD
ncbi:MULTISPECIES: hypothetical protein [Bacillus]|jgi:ABC-type phosphate/phosphonate transport system substrate-binding protein|nr:hypothetical protein [Bacillus cereus]MCC3289155.1 hypothetical protein [Bacillus cereus]WPD83352.1 hypothetical protein R8N76_28025 [Bacillus cereus ATCC 14579]SPT90187.1 Uncharacterised protein [Bacillus cereus]